MLKNWNCVFTQTKVLPSLHVPLYLDSFLRFSVVFVWPSFLRLKQSPYLGTWIYPFFEVSAFICRGEKANGGVTRATRGYTHTQKKNSLKGNSLAITVIVHVQIEKIHTTCCKTSINYSKKIPQTEPNEIVSTCLVLMEGPRLMWKYKLNSLKSRSGWIVSDKKLTGFIVRQDLSLYKWVIYGLGLTTIISVSPRK